MNSSYRPWTHQCFQDWDAVSSVAQYDFDTFCITYVYLIWASEETINARGNRFRVTCVLYQPHSGSYFENVFVVNDDPMANERTRRSYSIYQYMRSEMGQNLKTVFRFDNNRSRLMLQKRNGMVRIEFRRQ